MSGRASERKRDKKGTNFQNGVIDANASIMSTARRI